MKISSASKKVLASALSAAMVVAFAPTVAFGAQDGDKITVEYDLAGGYDSASSTQDQVKNAEYKVGTTTIADQKYTEAEANKENAQLDDAVKAGETKKGLTVFDDIYESVTGETAIELKVAGVEVFYSSDKTTVTKATNAQIADGDNLYKVKDDAKYDEDSANLYNATLTGAVHAGDVKKVGKSYASIQLASGSHLNLADDPSTSTVEGYSFSHWSVSYDSNEDGVIDEKDASEAAPAGGLLDVSDAKYKNGKTIKATAVYDAAKLQNVAATIDQGKGELTFAGAKTTDGKVVGTAKYVVTAPSGTATEKDALSKVTVAAEVGTWTVELKDGNGVTLDSQKVYVGSVVLTGGAYRAWGWADTTNEKYNTTQTVWYTADSDTNARAILDSADSSHAHTVAYKLDKDGKVTSEQARYYYTAEGKKASDVNIKAGAKGAISTTLTAAYASDEQVVQSFAFDKKDNALTAVIAGAENSLRFVSSSAAKDPATTDESGLYLAITNAKGEIVAETADTDGKANQFPSNGKTLSISNPEAGTYTATLYKVTPKNKTVGDTTPGKMEVVSTATAEVADIYAAAPTWAYTAKYKADGSVDGGSLVLTNNAGDGFKVLYGNAGSVNVEYDTAKGGLTIAASDFDSAKTYFVVAQAKDSKADIQKSKTVELFNYTEALKAFDDAAKSFNTKTVNGKVGSYYADNADVKAAVKAAEKTFTDKGFAEKTATATDATAAWKTVSVAAEQSVVDAVAGVAKAELGKYAAGVASADGKKATILTAEGYADAVKAVEAVSAAYAANHDGDKANNVAKVNDVSVSSIATYVDAVDKALENAVKGAKTLDAATVVSAKAVNDAIAALPAEITAANAEAAKAAAEKIVADYAALSADAKSLVASADYAKATDAIAAADKIIAEAAATKAAQDEAAVAKVKNKTLKTTTKKTKSVTFKTKVSDSGATVTYKKANKAGKSKVTVSKSGKVTAKKGLKKGTYKVKVKATAGAAAKTVTVTVKVSK